MADCNNLFSEFNSKIRLTDARREKLRNTRNILRDKIEKYFIDNDPDNTPRFYAQGSYVMDTIINPIDEDYDLDDGVYFFGALSVDDRPTPSTIHNWAMKAIGSHTDNVIDKNACIRVTYSDGFHIDLPMYYFTNDPDLAHKVKGWILSNPIEFIVWFEEKTRSGFRPEYILESIRQEECGKWLEDIRKADVQLRRIVRYLKAWSDYKKGDMPSGIILTILATKNFSSSTRDDISMYETLQNITADLKKEFVCKRPTTPKDENLFEGYSESRKEYFLNALDGFISSAKEAIDNPNQREACLKWQKHLGPRFSCKMTEDSNTEAKIFATHDVIRGNAKSAQM